MKQKDCSWIAYVWIIVGVLYALATWVPRAFAWVFTALPWWPVFLILVGLTLLHKHKSKQ